MTFFIATALKPVVLLIVLTALLVVRYCVIWFFPEGKIKRLLLLDIDRTGKRKTGRSTYLPKSFR